MIPFQDFAFLIIPSSFSWGLPTGEDSSRRCHNLSSHYWLCALQQKEINVAGNNPPLIRKLVRPDTQYREPFAGGSRDFSGKIILLLHKLASMSRSLYGTNSSVHEGRPGGYWAAFLYCLVFVQIKEFSGSFTMRQQRVFSLFPLSLIKIPSSLSQ